MLCSICKNDVVNYSSILEEDAEYLSIVCDRCLQTQNLFYKIPSDVLLIILSYLPLKDIVGLRSISLRMNELVCSHVQDTASSSSRCSIEPFYDMRSIKKEFQTELEHQMRVALWLSAIGADRNFCENIRCGRLYYANVPIVASANGFGMIVNHGQQIITWGFQLGFPPPSRERHIIECHPHRAIALYGGDDTIQVVLNNGQSFAFSQNDVCVRTPQKTKTMSHRRSSFGHDTLMRLYQAPKTLDGVRTTSMPSLGEYVPKRNLKFCLPRPWDLRFTISTNRILHFLNTQQFPVWEDFYDLKLSETDEIVSVFGVLQEHYEIEEQGDYIHGTTIVRTVRRCPSFAAILKDGGVIFWGYEIGCDFDPRHPLHHAIPLNHPRRWHHVDGKRAESIFSTRRAFAVLFDDGTLHCFGDPAYGGETPQLPPGKNISCMFATGGAFAAVFFDGSVMCWGDPLRGGKTPVLPLGIKLVSPAQTTATDVSQFFALRAYLLQFKDDLAVLDSCYDERGPYIPENETVQEIIKIIQEAEQVHMSFYGQTQKYAHHPSKTIHIQNFIMHWKSTLNLVLNKETKPKGRVISHLTRLYGDLRAQFGHMR